MIRLLAPQVHEQGGALPRYLGGVQQVRHANVDLAEHSFGLVLIASVNQVIEREMQPAMQIKQLLLHLLCHHHLGHGSTPFEIVCAHVDEIDPQNTPVTSSLSNEDPETGNAYPESRFHW